MRKGSEDVFRKVLTIAPQHKNHRGGIGAVIATYALHINGIKFIATYNGRYTSLQNIGLFILSLFQILWKLCTDREIKIVHIHGASKGSFVRKYVVFFIAKFLFRKKVIYHLHGGGFHLFYEKGSAIIRYFIKHFAKSVDVFICLSTRWHSYLSNEFNIKNLTIVNNPVTLPKKTGHLFLESKEYVLNLLFLGRIGENKGVFDLLKVIVKNKDQWDGRIKLRIGGDGEVECLVEYIKKHTLSNIIEYVGWVGGEKKDELLYQCDMLILPSYNEGLPISILEAMSYGKAIISTTVGGIPEVVRHGENGVLIEPGDQKSLADAVESFIKNPQLVREMGDRSKLYVQPYLMDNVMLQLNSIYSHESMD